MKQYLDIVHNVLTYGKNKQPVRKGPDGKTVGLENGTIALANVVFSHNMSDGFPLLTTKKMPLRVIAVELEGFLKGITDKKWFQERACKIWDEWANPMKVKEELDSIYVEVKEANGFTDDEYRKRIQLEETDLGPIYGYQWRKFGGQYGEVERNKPYTSVYTEHYEYAESLNGMINGGADQLKNIVDTLHKAPYDRRMVCSAWNPNQIHMMALPPCHYAWNITVIDDEINLAFIMRSVDTALGMPFNIASYGLLLSLLAKESGFKAGNLTALFVDCHIYNNQIKGCYEQLQRTPYKLPTLDVLSKNDEFSIFDWEHTDLKLSDYQHHSKLDFGAVTV